MKPKGLVLAPLITSEISIPNLSKDLASSLKKAILMSLKVFSIIFTASAAFTELSSCISASIIFL